jgi:hypothetical protein
MSRVREALRYRWFQAGLVVIGIVILIGVGALVFGYPMAWFFTAMSVGGLILALLTFRGMWVLNDPANRRRQE